MPRHALNHAAGGVQQCFIGDLKDDAFVDAVSGQTDLGDLDAVFPVGTVQAAADGSRADLDILFEPHFHRFALTGGQQGLFRCAVNTGSGVALDDARFRERS